MYKCLNSRKWLKWQKEVERKMGRIKYAEVANDWNW